MLKKFTAHYALRCRFEFEFRGYARPGVTVKSGSTGRNRFTFCCLMLGEADHQQDPPVEGILILAVVTK